MRVRLASMSCANDVPVDTRYVDSQALRDFTVGQKAIFTALVAANKPKVGIRNRCGSKSCGSSSSSRLSCEAGISWACGARRVGAIWRRKAFLVEQITRVVPCGEPWLTRDSSTSVANVKSAIVTFICGDVSGERKDLVSNASWSVMSGVVLCWDG